MFIFNVDEHLKKIWIDAKMHIQTFAERNWYKMVGKCVQIVSLYLNSHKFHHHHSLLKSYIDMGWFLGSSDLLIFLSSHTNMFCIESENLIYVVIPKVFIKTKIWHPKIKATRILRDVVIWRKIIWYDLYLTQVWFHQTWWSWHFLSYVCRFVDNENDLTEKLS